MSEILCPACSQRFDPRRHLVYGDLRSFLAPPRLTVDRQIDDSSLVQCPACGHRFQGDSVRAFAILGQRGQRRMIGLFVFTFLVVVLYVLYTAVF
jgi:uncharacterized Zn-finger protein